MKISQQKEVQLEKILNQMTNILMPNNFGAQMSEVRQFLQCAYNLFSSWKAKLNLSLVGNYDPNRFWPLFEDFLKESENGSWSQMSRHRPEIEGYKVQLWSSIQQLLTNSTNISRAIQIIDTATSNSSKNKIPGLTPFILSGIIFAYDEDNYMILDKPVMEYFDLKNYEEALLEYCKIVYESKKYSTKFKLSMWHINKAYGILSNQSQLPVKKLNGICRSKNSQNFSFPF